MAFDLRHEGAGVGRPLPGRDVAIAEDGEVLLRGDMVFGGYCNDRGNGRRLRRRLAP
jgi:long-subunit acyl-CoA synthetase (AMP-forming)